MFNESIQMTECTDPVIGDILSGWRYDISGLNPEMRKDYDRHLVECEHCASRQRLHRTIDVSLIALSSVSILVFMMALAIVHHVEPLRSFALVHLHLHQMSIVLSLREAAVGGLLVSLLTWILVAVTTPAPSYLTQQARVLQGRLPEEFKERWKISA